MTGFGKQQKFNYERWLASSMLEDGFWLLGAFWKRIILFALLGVAAAAAYNRWSPQEYLARATVRFIPPQVSESYVATNVAMQVEQRIFAVSQLAHSRLTATQMIETFGLYPQRRKLYPVADLVPDFQKRLTFSTIVTEGSEKAIPSILVSFRDADPNKAQKVVQRIVELVYEENRRYRSDQSIGTTDFLDQELTSVDTQIRELEGQLAKLPTSGGENQENGNLLKVENLNSLERRVTEIEHVMSWVLTDRNLRKNLVSDLEAQLAQRTSQSPTPANSLTPKTERLRQSLATAELAYQNLRLRYKPSNNEVVMAQQTVAWLQEQLAAQDQADAQAEHERDVEAVQIALNKARVEFAGYDETLQSHLNEKASLLAQITKLRSEFSTKPNVENERLRLTREYEAAKDQYDELSKRQQQSHIASNMERRGHGETAELVDPPTLPLHAEYPTEAMTLGSGGILGALLGYGFGLLSFFSAPKVRIPGHIGLLGDYPILVNLPAGKPLFRPSRFSISPGAKSTLMILMVAVLSSAACGRTGPERIKTEILEGTAALKAGNHRVAEIHFRRALQIDARIGEAYAGLAQVYLQSGESMRGYEQLIRAGELLPNRSDIAEHLADLTYQVYFADPGRPVAILRELEVRANNLMKNWPTHAAGFRLAGQVLLERHRNAEAIDLMEAALEQIEDGALRTQLASIYFQNGDKTKAEEQLRHTIRVNPTYTPASDLLYLQLMERGETPVARKVLEQKLDRYQNLESALQLAAHDDASGSRYLAEELLEKLGRDFADGEETFARIGDFWLHRGEFTIARRWYQDGLTKNVNNRGLYAGRLAEILLAEKKPADAQALVSQELAAHPDDLSLRAYHAAFGLDSRSLPDRQKMQAELETVLAKMPNSPFVRLHLGRAYLLNGDMLRAGELFRSAITLDPNYAPGWLALADAELRAGNSERAKEQLQLLLKRSPNYVPARLLQAQASLAQNKPAEAEQALSSLNAADPENPEVMMALARAKINLGQHEAAIGLLERSAALRPQDPRPVLLQARLEVENGRAKAALARLRAAQPRMMGAPEVASMIGSVALVAGEPDVALFQFEQLVKRDRASLQYQLGYASSLALSGKTAEAREQFQAIQKKAGNDPQPWLLYGAMMSSAGNVAGAGAAYEEVLKRDAKNPYALNNLAFILARRGDELDRALALAEEARHALPRSREIGDTLVYIYVRKGMKRNAVAALEQLADNLPASQQKHTRSLLEQIQRGDLAGVRREMEREDGWN